MPKTLNVDGHIYNRLTIISRVGRRKALCRCECGNEIIAQLYNVKNGHTKSCGCFKLERSPVINKTHGMRRTPTYKSWSCMRARCNNPKNADYKNYGARGITCHQSWDSFESFFSDMGEKPDGTTLERMNNDGNYEPGNCRWATKREQALNRRTSRFVTAHGRTMTLKEWADVTGLTYILLYKKFSRRGFPLIDPGLIPKPNGEL